MCIPCVLYIYINIRRQQFCFAICNDRTHLPCCHMLYWKCKYLQCSSFPVCVCTWTRHVNAFAALLRAYVTCLLAFHVFSQRTSVHTRMCNTHIPRYVSGSLQLVTSNLNIFVFHCGAMGPKCAKIGSFRWWHRPRILVV